MFNDLNMAQIIGNITADLELRYTASGTPVTSFSVATNRSYKQGEEWKEEVAFHNVVVWAKRAESLVKYAKKGTRVYVSGRMQTRSWEDQEGKKNYKMEIVADEVILLARYVNAKGGESAAPEPSEPAGGDTAGKSEEATINPSDLPF